jgi:ELWxxDGT repeat protein
MVIDIAPGSGNSLTNSVLQVAGNMLVFQASDGVHVTQDWVSDGTAAGTHMVTDNTKPMDSNPFGFVSLIALIGNTAETLTGTHDDDHIDGGGGDDVLAGKGGDDIFTGGGGNDTIDGGAGHDTIVYSGNITDYVVTTDPSGNLVVADQRVNAPDGTDTLMSVETLQFNNGSITYDLNGAANWSTITTLLDAAGSTGGVYVTLDGGDSWATTYDVFQQSPVMWATAHIGADQKPILTVTTNDDGTHSLRVFDHDNVYSWASFTVGYDANWNQTSFSGTNDDSSTNLTIGQVADALDSALWFTTPYDPYFEQQPFNLTLTGGGDTDILFGRAADDTINGGGGADQIWGGRGDDTLTGGSGLDVFHFAPGDGNDTITDFSALFGGNDRIDLHGFGFTSYSDLTPLMSSSGNDVLITFDARDHILIQGVGNTLNASDFIFT